MRKDGEPLVTVPLTEYKPTVEIPSVDLKVDAKTRQLVFTFNESGFELLRKRAGDALEREGATWQISVK